MLIIHESGAKARYANRTGVHSKVIARHTKTLECCRFLTFTGSVAMMSWRAAQAAKQSPCLAGDCFPYATLHHAAARGRRDMRFARRDYIESVGNRATFVRQLLRGHTLPTSRAVWPLATGLPFPPASTPAGLSRVDVRPAPRRQSAHESADWPHAAPTRRLSSSSAPD